MVGFSYNGIHSSEFGLYYIPNWEEQWIADAEYDVYDSDVDWKHGGYYYGNKAKVRTFTIKCYFEEIDIATRQAIKQWVGRETSGRLIFDDMPFVYWNVRPGKIPVGNWYMDNNDTHSGTVTITLKAYEPFGHMLRKYNTSNSPDDGAEDYTNILDGDDMPAVPTVDDTSFDIYNPGTEACGLTIELEGSTDNPIRFFNDNNKSFCAFEGLPGNNMHIMIDGETGFVSTFISGSSEPENGYPYHDKGVVRLDPNHGRSGVGFRYIGPNGTLHSFELTGIHIDNSLINAELTIEGLSGATFRVVTVFRANNRVYCSMEGSGNIPASGVCSVKTVNHIRIEEKINGSWSAPETLALTYIGVDYEPKAL